MSSPETLPYGATDNDQADTYLVTRRGRCRVCSGSGWCDSPAWAAAVEDTATLDHETLRHLEEELGPREVTCLSCDGVGTLEVDVPLEEALRGGLAGSTIGCLAQIVDQRTVADRRLLLVAAAVQGLLARKSFGPGVPDLLTPGVVHFDAVEHVSAAAVVVADAVIRRLDAGSTAPASCCRPPEPRADGGCATFTPRSQRPFTSTFSGGDGGEE